jgi:TonB family protein
MREWLAAVLLLFSADQFRPPAPQTPLPSGNRIVAQDGDTVVVDHDTRVRIVRRIEAHVRAIFNATEGWLIVLADHANDGGPDGGVDSTRTYYGVTGDWPLGPRWEGQAAIEEYMSVGPNMGPPGFGLRTSDGLIQFLSYRPPDIFRDAEAIAVISSRGSSGGLGGGMTFDEAERTMRAQARQNAPQHQAGDLRFYSGGASGGGPPAVASGDMITALTMSGVPAGAVRVGGNVAPPSKVHDVPATAPDEALRAGARGVVIIEATIDVDGTVKDARVLRSIPMLDAAAVAAVRQWRYTPTLLNGQAVPVIMTVTVPFP